MLLILRKIPLSDFQNLAKLADTIVADVVQLLPLICGHTYMIVNWMLKGFFLILHSRIHAIAIWVEGVASYAFDNSLSIKHSPLRKHNIMKNS